MDEKNILDRIEKLEKEVDVLSKSNSNTLERLARMETKIDYISDNVKSFAITIEALRQKPADRWNTLVTSLITACAGGFVGFLISRLLGGVK